MNTADVTNRADTRSITWGDLTWIDVTEPTQNDVRYLSERFGFHHLALEDSLSRMQRPKVDHYDSYLFAVFHFPVERDQKQVIKSHQVSSFVGNNYLVTLHDGHLKALTDLFERCEGQEETRRELFARGSSFLLYNVLNGLIQACFPILDKLLSSMDDAEDAVFDENTDDTKDISLLRRAIITQRRIIMPLRSVITDLKVRVQPYGTVDLGKYYDDLLDQVNRIWEALEESKEVIEVFKDSDFVLVTNRINRIVQTLAIFSSIVLPFLIVSGIYGMNINLPGGVESGSLASFGILLGVMLLISGSLLYYFHRRRWI